MNSDSTRAKTISVLCILVLSCILVAGLWPFHVPHNEVSWLKNDNGLRFDRHGAAVSASEFRSARPSNDTGASLEVRLVPATTNGGGVILAFDSSPDTRAPFLLRQLGSTMVVHRYLVDQAGNVTQPWFKVAHAFEAGKSVFVTLTSDKNKTECYLDGVLAGTAPDPGIASPELTGRLVLANSTVDDSWRGEIEGLAIYDRELTPVQLREHFHSWAPDHGPLLTREQPPIALYLFNERAGSIVHNLVDSATNLTIPAHYFVVHPGFLRLTWNADSHASQAWHRWSTWQGLLVNIGGFVPVGFVFFAYFSSVRRNGHPALVAILLGFFLSFAVEVLQRFLPNRDSGLNDIFTNTAGTAVGVLLHRSSIVRALWTKALNLVVAVAGGQGSAVKERNKSVQNENLTFSV